MSKEIIEIHHYGNIWVDNGGIFKQSRHGGKYFCISHKRNAVSNLYTIKAIPLSKWWLIRKFQIRLFRQKLMLKKWK